MQRNIEAVDCSLCHKPAERWALRNGVGYIYDCRTCGEHYCSGPPDEPNSVEVEALKGDVPPLVKRTRRISDRIDYTVSLISGEWLLSSLRLSNGGSVIVLRAIFVAGGCCFW